MQVKALACELPATLGAAALALELADIGAQAQQCGIVATHQRQRPSGAGCMRTPSGPGSIAAGSSRAIRISLLKAGRILDLYARRWEGNRLRDDEFVLSTDEKTSIQARARIHPTLPPAPGTAHARRARVRARAAPGPTWPPSTSTAPKSSAAASTTTGIAPFERLVAQVMTPAARTATRGACSGSWTTAPRIAASRACDA